MDKNNQKEELTMQNIPKAVNYLINEIAEIRVLLEHIEKQLGLGVDKHRPIGTEDVCRILGVTINILNKMIRERSVPHYEKGKKIYFFFENELIKWVESSKVKTYAKEYSNKRRYENALV